MMTPHRHTQKGFTIVELTITVGILAILAAFATPALVQTLRKTQFNKDVRAVSDAFQTTRGEAVMQKRSLSATPSTDLQYANISPTTPVTYDFMGRADSERCFVLTHKEDASITTSILVREVGNPEIFKNRTSCQ